ncbi:MAG: hypothetical protein HZB26_15675, partial [Candidatus Hydrogenedentes bacterium]|nr:hypothetical protein [Candidatus Hydrogenedentota bacterium]
MLGWGKSKKTESAPAKVIPPAGVTTAARGPSASAAAASAPAKPKITKTLGEILVTEGVITEGQRKEALALHATSNESLVQILIEKGYLHGNLLSSFLAKRFGLPHVSLLDCLVNDELFQYVPKDLCRRYSVLPLDRLGSIVTLAMVNPLDQEALEAVRKHCPDMRIKSILCDWNGFKSVAERVLEGEKKVVDLTASSLGLSVQKAPAAPAHPAAQPAPAEKVETQAP